MTLGRVTPPPGPVSLHQISQYYERLKHKPDLSAALAKHKHDPSWPPSAKRGSSPRAGDYILATCEVLSGLDRWGISTRETLLMQQGESTHAKWAVDWAMLGKAMKRSLVEAIIRDKLGDKAIRCWRILEAKGKLEEKHVRAQGGLCSVSFSALTTGLALVLFRLCLSTFDSTWLDSSNSPSSITRNGPSFSTRSRHATPLDPCSSALLPSFKHARTAPDSSPAWRSCRSRRRARS